ncbi:hypothetical protein BJR07_03535 [Bacillus cereus]|uniref:Uncharacterized protein n=1 Tax=Bacillus cereus TaxID=1396 RepID=A0A1Q4LFP0_BACCE|nr:hypothetical protein BJR06_13710 [Bacillus cereus]OKA41000.1 hypothetical protein BJR07_03535 [Bacillus cereus]
MWKTRGWDLLKKIMIGILLHELLHLNEYQEECGVYLYKKQNIQQKSTIMLYNDFNKPYFRN